MSEGSTKLALVGGVGAAAFALGYMTAPREILDENAEQSGLFQVDTTKVLSATVESLRSENSLVVFSYKGTAKVSSEACHSGSTLSCDQPSLSGTGPKADGRLSENFNKKTIALALLVQIVPV